MTQYQCNTNCFDKNKSLDIEKLRVNRDYSIKTTFAVNNINLLVLSSPTILATGDRFFFSFLTENNQSLNIQSGHSVTVELAFFRHYLIIQKWKCLTTIASSYIKSKTENAPWSIAKIAENLRYYHFHFFSEETA